jgi:hypothetical protein
VSGRSPVPGSGCQPSASAAISVASSRSGIPNAFRDLAGSLRSAWRWCSGYEPSWSLLLKECDEAADALEKLEAENTLLKALISPESIERFATDIACAIIEPRQDLVALRHGAMVRLGERLRNPYSRDIAAAQAIEAQRAETAQQGSVEDESAVAKPCAQTSEPSALRRGM